MYPRAVDVFSRHPQQWLIILSRISTMAVPPGLFHGLKRGAKCSTDVFEPIKIFTLNSYLPATKTCQSGVDN